MRSSSRALAAVAAAVAVASGAAACSSGSSSSSTSHATVLPIGLAVKLTGQYSEDVPALMAGVLLSALPLVILFIFMRKQVMNSLGGIVAR